MKEKKIAFSLYSQDVDPDPGSVLVFGRIQIRIRLKIMDPKHCLHVTYSLFISYLLTSFWISAVNDVCLIGTYLPIFFVIIDSAFRLIFQFNLYLSFIAHKNCLAIIQILAFIEFLRPTVSFLVEALNILILHRFMVTLNLIISRKWIVLRKYQ